MLLYDTEVVVGDKNHFAVPGYILHQFVGCNTQILVKKQYKKKRSNFKDKNDISVKI